MNSFVWNPEGTLARWDDPSVAYDRVFSYDEEGRLVRIEVEEESLLGIRKLFDLTR
ncbi:MAG: hypothetical protein KatS3mg017_0396 [Fimbriimonadales bacterium]|nr:MAG: hypothetical protein KatS3mg017_0396 [Fimbriimonadales bacterium]